MPGTRSNNTQKSISSRELPPLRSPLQAASSSLELALIEDPFLAPAMASQGLAAEASSQLGHAPSQTTGSTFIVGLRMQGDASPHDAVPDDEWSGELSDGVPPELREAPKNNTEHIMPDAVFGLTIPPYRYLKALNS